MLLAKVLLAMGLCWKNMGKEETFAAIWVRHEQLESATGHQLYIQATNI